MAKHKNYVYYEADCTMSLINPFTDLETENPSMASFNSKALKVVHIVVPAISCYLLKVTHPLGPDDVVVGGV